MIKHIVMWKLKDKADAEPLKKALEALRGKIPGLLNIEVGIDFNQSEHAADVVLYAELESRDALAAYQEHPEHTAVIPMVQTVAVARTVVDYEI